MKSTEVQNPQRNCRQSFAGLLPTKKMSLLFQRPSLFALCTSMFTSVPECILDRKDGNISKLLVSREPLG